jgi:NAD(P)H-hydrate repair Nnr-like enzyme with NAD(P)H-hydrate dehydratase domain
LVLLESVDDVQHKLVVQRRNRQCAFQSGSGDTLTSIVESIVGLMEAKEKP